MLNLVIIGSGIIGLSIAEYFSRNSSSVTIISNNNPLSGSYAAAANLATKGQLFGRDPHFQLKLDAKKTYPTWIQNLFDESSSIASINDVFKIGRGIDIFHNQLDRDKHLKRVLQNKEELITRILPLNSILARHENEIIYQDEAWVDASFLLNLLNEILRKRGVHFLNENLTRKNLNKILEQKEKKSIIFCTGAWTKQLLIELGLPLSNGFNKPERLTVGSTFIAQNSLNLPDKNFILYEKIAEGLKLKATFSGNSQTLTLSSSSLKIQNTSIKYTNDLDIINNNLLEFALNKISFEKQLLKKTGFRVGYGHSEILVEPIELTIKNSTLISCCGAHKSGFLFAPQLGQMIETLM